MSDEGTLNFSDGSQLVVSSSFDDIDTFFSIDEAVVFSIMETSNHESFCNIGDSQINTILVDEKIRAIKVYFEEISYADKKISDKTLTYLIGLFLQNTEGQS